MLIQGDCRDALKELEDSSIDSLVTDPPAGISFMGKDWDGGSNFIPKMTEIFHECLRVMKPGAHGLVWALPRTSHWTATALENAGFEIRDVITHLFGSGFPKSLDISKAIDKAAGAEREVVGKYQSPENTTGDSKGGLFNGGGLADITAPATDDAAKWQGWGTALKPASEHWILIRKPCSEKTVAQNVLKHGTGGINIDGCRINLKPGETTHGSGTVFKSEVYELGHSGETRTGVPNLHSTQGRFPANLVLDEEAAKMLDEQSSTSTTGKRTKNIDYQSKGMFPLGSKQNEYTDSGGASRFFYCAKASRKDRGEDNKHPTVKATKLMEYLITLVTPPKGIVLDPFMGSGSTGKAAGKLGFKFIGIEKEKEYFDIAMKRCE